LRTPGRAGFGCNINYFFSKSIIIYNFLNMNFQEINSYIAPVGLIVAGLVVRLSKNKETFGVFKNYWYLLIIIGLLLLTFRLYSNFS
jgi:hypothetical protein